jgi:hypothetical protein
MTGFQEAAKRVSDLGSGPMTMHLPPAVRASEEATPLGGVEALPESRGMRPEPIDDRMPPMASTEGLGELPPKPGD